MMTLTNWLMLFLAASLASVSILVVVLAYLTQTRWMRIFSESRGIPAITMEPSVPREPVKPKTDDRPRMTIPLPGSQMFKKQVKQ